MESFATFHPVHGLIAGGLVYFVSGKALPALAVGGGLYAYMTVYGHNLPGSAPARRVDIPLMPVGPISHDPLHPTIFKALG